MVVRSIRAAAVGVLLFSTNTQAQDTVQVVTDVSPAQADVLDQTSAIARRAVEMFNRVATVRFFESTRLERSQIFGGVAIYNARLIVSGSVETIVAINASVEIESDAVVHGDIIVLGGTLTLAPGATIAGNTRQQSLSVAVRQVGDQLELLTVPGRSRNTWTTRRTRPFQPSSGVDFDLEINTYNRVEGLPIHFGPVLKWGSESHRVRVFGAAVFRTEGDFETNRQDMGYRISGQWDVGRSQKVRLTFEGFDLVRPVEHWKLHDLEVGLATFLWHRDYRDYYLQRGVAGAIDFRPTNTWLFAGRLSSHEETSVAARDPWTPWRGNDVWRTNPAIDQGDFREFTLGVRYDQTRAYDFNGTGWYFDTQIMLGTSDNVIFEPTDPSIRSDPAPGDYSYERLFIDVRRYERIGSTALLSLRGVGGGTIGDSPLPLQRRLSLGGIGDIPGLRFRELSCQPNVPLPGSPALCDRVVMFQGELRTGLDFDRLFNWESDDRKSSRRSRSSDRPMLRTQGVDWNDNWWDDDELQIVLFGDAGTGWIHGQPRPAFEGDIGIGLEIGDVGIYAAKPLIDGRGATLTLRAHRRF